MPARWLAVAMLLAALGLPAALSGQPASGRTYHLGTLHVGDHIPPDLGPLREGLTAAGYVEGRNLEVDSRNLPDEGAAARVAREFVQARVDVIVAIGNPSARAARAATSEIPIVMLHVTDPVSQGLVKTLARPGGNATGFVFFAASAAKQLEIFKELVPRLRRVLVLVDPGDPAAAGRLADMRAAASVLGLSLLERTASHQRDVERVFAGLKPADADGVAVASVDLQIRFTALLIGLTTERRLPLATYRREAVHDGALFSYAPDVAAVGRRAAVYVDRILKGTRPGDLPVEQPTAFELVINLRTARTLGLTIPPAIQARADHVVE
jgi:ABC-type uncharacterized transport system substrate-binding protein